MTERQNVDIWSVEIDREGLLNRLTTNPLVDSFPLWAPDGARFVAISTVGTERGLVIKRVDGSAPDELVSAFGTESGAINAVRIPTDWTPDGRALLLKVADPITGTFDLALLSLDGQREPQPIASTPYNERDGQFSPDGRWLAFESNESGTPEIYVQPFPGPGPKQRVSTASGTQARWRRDGRELFYVALDGALMAVPVDLAPDRPSFGPPTPLFKTRLAPSVAISRQQYVVANDGERFLMVSLDDAPTPPITLLLNWQPPAVAR
jgi:Tol biopolymer transport system component